MALPRLAVIATIYFPFSHSDVIVTRWLEPRDTDLDVGWPAGENGTTRTQIASFYIEQRDEKDMGVEFANRHGIPLYNTVREALTLGGDTLAVDGVLLIGEHGEYGYNEFFQKMYPRRELFDAITAVFRQSGRSVPVFNDKHLSYDPASAIHMVDTAAELGFPLMAGSSVPIAMRQEASCINGDKLDAAVAVYFGGAESYGYHSIELLQSVIGRRQGGESGIAAVTAYYGESFWQAQAAGVWPEDLFEEGLRASTKNAEGSYRDNLRPIGVPEGMKPMNPVAFHFEHLDGLHSFHIMLHGHVREFSYALRTADGGVSSASTHTISDSHETLFPHFAMLNGCIEDFMLTGKATYPVEHYLLSTLATDLAVRSLAQPGTRLETPEMAVSYVLQG